MAENLNTPSDDEIDAILAERIRDRGFQDTSAVARDRGNDLANTEFQQDLQGMSQAQLATKYGREVALQRNRMLDGKQRLQQSDNSDRNFSEVVSDSAVAAATALYRDAGSLGILAYSYGKGALDEDFDGRENAAKLLQAHGKIVSEIKENNLSTQLQTKQYFDQIEGQLDGEDNQAIRDREVADGTSPFWADVKAQGRNFMNAGERVLKDPTLAGNLISEGVGSLVASAPLAGVGGLAAKGATAAVTRNILAQRVAQAIGVSAAAGASEVAGVYSETVSDVMDIPTNELLKASPIMQGLIREGMTPEEAKVQLAGMTAETAALRQIPATLALGFITSKFERMPIGVFTDTGITKGLLQIAGEGIEEAGQGASGTLNRNMAVEEYANIGRSVFEGVGEEAAIGALAGMGTAGVAATPAAAKGTSRIAAQGAVYAANALFNETQYTDPVTGESVVKESRANRAVQSIVESTRTVAGGIKTVSDAATTKLESYNNRDQSAQSMQEIQDTVEAARVVDQMVEADNFDETLTEKIRGTDAKAPSGMTDTVGSNVVLTAANALKKVTQKGFNPTKEDKAFVAQQIASLKAIGNSLPMKARRQIAKIVSSKEAETILSEVSELDLNKEIVSEADKVSTTINVAKTNPANVNPVETKKILEESGKDITPEDAKYLRVASSVAETINKAVGNIIGITEKMNVALKAQGRNEVEIGTLETTSRSILAEGYTNAKGEKLRSVNDFVSDIVQGSQSPDGTIINQKGEVVPVRNIAEQFAKLLIHMNNKVEALNLSYDQNKKNAKGEMMASRGQRFRKLVDGENFIDPEKWLSNDGSVTYHRDRAGSVGFAERVELDRNVIAEVYSQMAEAFPEIFDGLDVPSDLVQLKRDFKQPTGIEEVSPETDEQNQDNTNNEQPTAVEADSSPDEDNEQNQTQNERQSGLTSDQLNVVNDDLFDVPQDFKDIILNDPVQGDLFSPTAIEEEITSESEANKNVISDELTDDELNEILNSPQKWDADERKHIAKNIKTWRVTVKAKMEEVLGKKLAARVRSIKIFPASIAKREGLGITNVNDQVQEIYLSAGLFDENGEMTPHGVAVALHETAHVIDYTNPKYGDVSRWLSEMNIFEPTGKVAKEFYALLTSNSFIQGRIDYVMSFETNDPIQHKAEMFAVLSTFYLSKDGTILENSPETIALMEEIYGPRDNQKALETESDVSEQYDEGTSESTGTEVIAEGQNRPKSESLDFVYPREENTNAPETLADVVKVVENNGGLNSVVVGLMVELAPKLNAAINKRLFKIRTMIDGKTESIARHIRENPKGLQAVMQYKFTMLADTETGEINKNMVDLATIAIVDWLVGASQMDPSRMSDTLEKAGLSYADLKSDKQASEMALGLPSSTLKPRLANAILKMWGVKANKKAAMVDYYGVAEGLAAEMLMALETEGYLEVKRIELAQMESLNDATGEKTVVHRETDTVLLNMEKIREFQQKVGESRQPGVATTAKEYFLDEVREQYSIGEKIRFQKNKNLSSRENRARQKMQDTAHFYNQELGDMFFSIGDKNLMRLLGYVEDVNIKTVPNRTLRLSIQGKNLSIINSMADAELLTRQLSREDPVYYPVDITSVGRHQYQGVNPQTNKFLRALVTPTWTTVDIATQEDLVWLAVAQGTGIAKIEKRNHAKILETIESDFLTRYGEAYKQARMLLEGRPFDSHAFTESVLGSEDSVEPQVIAAIFTLAKMQHAKANGETTFESSLSVELDGLTNGAANMMVNFMQGILSPAQFENLKRIGLYLGKKNQSINDFFGIEGNLDMYEVVARLAQSKMIKMLNNSEMGLQAAAANRIAGHFGDFKKNEKTGEFEMTRNSAKNPMTKVNYGSGVLGVGSGLADEMMLKIFEALHVNGPSNISYAGDLIADLKTLGVTLPKDAQSNWEPSGKELKSFRWNISQTIGKALTEAAKETLGDKITEVNDMLVFSTNVQAAYLNEIFNEKMIDMGERLANEGKIRRHPKTNKPVMRDIPVEEYDKIVKELEVMAPIFTSDEQTLELGGFKIKVATNWPVLSATMDNRLNQHPMLKQPDDVGVKAIPFTVIGTGDAMMMNLIFGRDDAPEDVLGIFDGLDVPLTKLAEYAPMANQAVMESWDRDVLAMVVENFRGFLSSDLDADALNRAYAVAKDKSKKSSVTAQNSTQLLEQLDNRLRQNRAFKAVLKKIAVSVDQMGGSAVGFSRGEGNLGLNAINDMIRRELAGNPVTSVEEINEVNVKEPVNETTVKAVLRGIRFSEAQKKILSLIEPVLTDTRVIFGTLDQLNIYRRENFPDDGLVMTAPAQYDPVNNVLFMTKATPETVLHELVHAATFNRVLAHYNGETNENVTRLEALMDEFLNIKDGEAKVREAQASILMRKGSTDPFDKAAAVNELMAYVLANDIVRKKAQNTQSNLIASLGSKIIKLMRRLLGGVPESVFDGVVFNTAMLIGTPIPDDAGDGGNGNGGGDNTGGDLTPSANNYTNYWINLLSEYLDKNKNNTVTQGVRMDQQVKARNVANQIVDSFRQVGMLQNDEARLTFKAIYGVINSDIKLRGQPLIAMTKLYEHVIENMSPEMFGSGSEAAQEYSAVLNAFGQDNDQISSIAVLLALSQTSAKFRTVLDQIPEPESGETSQKLQNTLTGLASATMDNITATISEKGAPKEIMDSLAALIVEHDTDREWMILRKLTSSLTAADNYVSGKLQQIAELMRLTDEKTKASTRSKAQKYMTSALTLGTNYLDQTGTDFTNQAIKDKVHMGIPFLKLIPIREMVAEMVGTDAINQNVVALQDKVNFAISGMRQAYRENLPGIMARLFSEKPTVDQWKTMFNVLAKTDFTRFVDPTNIAASMQLISDAPTRNRRIRQLESQLELALGPVISVDAKEKAEQLATYMNTGEVGKLLMRNAYAIAKNLDGDYDSSLVPILDELITVYAIDMQSPEQRQEIINLYNNDTDAMEMMMTYMQRLNTEEDNKPNISEMAKLNAYKGYIPNESSVTLRVIVEDDRNELDMKSKGFIKLKPYVGDPNSLIDKSYYISNIRSRNQYAQGALQYVAATYRGVDVNTGLSVNGNTTGYISGDGIVGRTVDALNDPTYTMENNKEGLIPVFDVDGTVSGFERSINPDILDQHAKRNENLAIMLGAWAGRQLEETAAMEYNLALIDELDDIWQKRERGSDGLFVNLKTTTDPIYRESYRLIPHNLKAYIDSKFGGEGMMVRTDMANLSVGYPEASLADMWTGKTRIPKEVQKTVVAVTQLFMGRNAMKNVIRIEEAVQGTVSYAKDIIVIKSLVVPALNMQANVAQLATRGVPLKTMKRSFQEKLAEIEAYNNNITKIMELKAMVDFKARDINQKKILMDKIKVLEDLNKKMSIAPMIEAGAYKQLSEGISEFDTSITAGKLGDYVEAQVAKLPSGVRVIAEHALVSKTTKIYQIANRATQYGDFLAKSIYYDHLLTQGLSPDMAVSKINEEFVNFSSQPGRIRSALERNGLSWFMAFKIRIAKIAMQQMRDNPVRALAMNVVWEGGSPIQDNIFSVMVDGRLDYATGYEMLFAAPELNPWVSLLED